MIEVDFDAHERSRWAGRAQAYRRSFGRLCAYPAEALLDAAAVRAGRRVLDGPGGRVAVTLWPSPHPPLQRLWGEALDAAGVAPPTDLPRLAPGRDFPRTGPGVTGLLSTAGLVDAGCATLSWTHRADPDDWWAGPAAGISAIGLVVQRQEPAVRARIRREYDRLTAGCRDADGMLALPTAALLGSATVE
ncbi:hypothetical protein [Micromonospora sp. NPDC049282]|uniref:hypothetical protein n=1 Tax=Micromonospora sp. NPDC049282 TaxID=3364269 RepID=UPI00371C89C9